MPEEFQEKVNYLCTLISDVEWSGILFYSMEGTIQDPENCVITLEDILPMDKGSQAYTEYTFDKRIDEYIEEDFENRVQWHIGHVHSHNTMQVFFSGVDMSELVENSEAHNIYLSLIVNNKLDYVAKVAFRGELETVVANLPFMATDENGEKYEIGTGDVKITSSKFYTYDCDIQVPQNQQFDNSGWGFAKRVAALFAPKRVETYTPPAKKVYPLPIIQQNQHNMFEDDPFSKETDIPNMSDAELVLACCLKGSLVLQGEENLVMVLDEIGEVNPVLLSSQLSDNYAPWYENLFQEQQDPIDFLDILEESIAVLEELQDTYPFLEHSVEVLKSVFTKMEESIKYGTTI